MRHSQSLASSVTSDMPFDERSDGLVAVKYILRVGTGALTVIHAATSLSTSTQDVPTESQVKYIAREVLNHQELSLFEHPVRMLFSLEGRRRRRIHGRILTSSSSSCPVVHPPAL